MKNQHADGVIWAQGEADARSLAGNSPNGQTTTANFEEATTEIFQYIRDQLNDPDLPIFIQQLGSVTSRDYVGGIDAMRAVQQHIADTMDNVFIAAVTTDLALGSDHLHFAKSSYETIAGRLADFVGDYIHDHPGNPGGGGDGNDVIDGGPGSDIINGSDGADIIILRAGQGNDRINDFQDGVDKIALTGGLSFGDLDIADINGWAQLSVGGEKLAKFQGISASQLTAADVIDASDVPPPDGLSWADPDNLLL